jgi:hypothetical protein
VSPPSDKELQPTADGSQNLSACSTGGSEAAGVNGLAGTRQETIGGKMNWEAIGAIGEIVGGAGVIISLLYLAIQIRKDARARRANAIHEQSRAFAEAQRTAATNTELLDVYFRGIQDFSCLKGPELVRFSAFFGHTFRVWEDSYFQWMDGNLDRRIWNGHEAIIDDMVSLPGVHAWWPTRSHWYSAEFQAVIQKKISEARPQTMYRNLAAQPDDADDQ